MWSAASAASDNLGLVLRAERKYETAIESFDEALKIDPKYDLARAARKDCVRALKAKGLPKKARQQNGRSVHR